MSRPEYIAPAQVYYNEQQALKYANNSHIIRVQTQMTERAIELLGLDDKQYILDIGCGSGLSGGVLEAQGHEWVGVDISQDMLVVASDRGEGSLVRSDCGSGLPFKPGTFDGAISISMLQWLCNAENSEQNPYRRLFGMFTALYACLARGGRAVLQFYPADSKQTDMIKAAANRAGFGGGVVVDSPEGRAKYFLVLETTSNHVRRSKPRVAKKSKQWIHNKKETMRKRGHEVFDSKYTGRKRRPKF